MPAREDLFRQTAVAARFQSTGSAILITTAPSSRVVACLAALLSTAIAAVAGWGEITRTVTVSGALVPTHGVIRVFSPQQGVVTAKRFSFGDHVSHGQALYILSSDRDGTAVASLAGAVSIAIHQRITALESTIEVTKLLEAEEVTRLTRQRDDLFAQAVTMAAQIRLQAETVAFDQKIVDRKSSLRLSDILTVDQLEVSQRQLASDHAYKLSLQVSAMKLGQALAETEAQLRELPLKQTTQLDDLNRQHAQADADLADNEMRREIVITAPESGSVSAELAEIGNTVTSGTPMAVIAPGNSALEAHLLVPSSGIGFIRPGSLVALRYRAFPYQKFGIYEGHVRVISAVALNPAEMEALHVPVDGNEPIYRVTVDLAKQTVDALGEQQKLIGGMLVDADISAETRRVWEWIFEPVYSMRGTALFGSAR